MYSIKGSSCWVGKTFALAKSNDSGGGKKSRIRRSKEERKTMVESFIINYQKLNNGNFPSLNLTHKEVGGSFYTVREIVREIIQENRVLGPAMLTLRQMSSDQFMAQYPLGSLSVKPQIPSSLPSGEDNNVSRHHHEVTCEGVVIISEADSELQNVDNKSISDSVQVNVETAESDGITSTEPKVTATSEGHEKQSVGNGYITNGFQKDVKGSKFDENASSELQKSGIAQTKFHEQYKVDIGNVVGGIQADIRSGPSNGLAGKEPRVSETSEINIGEQESVDDVNSEIREDVNSSVSNEVLSTEFQENTSKADCVDEKQNIGNRNITDGDQVDVKTSGSDELMNTELPESPTSEADIQEPQSAIIGQITNGHQLGVKNQGSDQLTSEEFQSRETSKGFIDAKEIKSSAKATQIIEDVVVETFPIRPTTKPADSNDTSTDNGRNLPKTPEEKEAPKVELQPRSSSHHVNGMPSHNVSGKQKPPTAAAEATTPPVNSDAKVLNGKSANRNDRITITQEASTVKSKADNGQTSSAYQKESNRTLDSHSWPGASKISRNQGTNPMLAIFKAFVHAFVKFWSE